jgi:hypothetical protein
MILYGLLLKSVEITLLTVDTLTIKCDQHILATAYFDEKHEKQLKPAT